MNDLFAHYPYQPTDHGTYNGSDREVVRYFPTMNAAIDAAESDRNRTESSTTEFTSHRMPRDIESDRFFGTASWSDAVCLYRDGWVPGVSSIASARERLTIPSIVETRVSTRFDLAGGAVDVGRFLGGDPECMRRIVVKPSVPVVTVAVAGAFLADADADMILANGAGVVALVELLAAAGYGVKVDLVGRSRAIESSRFHWSVVVGLKEPGEPLDIGALAFAMAHPSTFRRFIFGLRETDHRTVARMMGAPGGYGSTTYASDLAAGYDIDLTDEPVHESRVSDRIAAAVDRWISRGVPGCTR